MPFQFNIRLSGASGQGLLQAARMLAEAAAIYDGKNAAESCAYGPEARGSAAKVDIIISDGDIDYPKIDSIDCLIVLTQEAYERYVNDLRPEGTVIAEAGIETGERKENRRVHKAPFGEIALKTCGRMNFMHLVALGYFAAVNAVIGEQSIRQAVLARSPKSCEHCCIQAYEAGLSAAREIAT
jgi:2-oxoglutarate ferredoxin oxidoreductase subunit gamma